MRGTIANAMVVEVNTTPNKEGKVYPKLNVVEIGKAYPKLMGLRIEGSPGSLNELVGKVCNLEVDMEEYSGKTGPYSVYTFVGVARKSA